MIALSAVRLDPARGILRESPRPVALRNATYADQFDWDTLFYDVYRVDRHIVLQGPPFYNLLAPLRASTPLAGLERGWFPRLAHIGRDKRGELWLRSDAETLNLDGPLGTWRIAVQPDGADRYAGLRALTTMSKDNAPRWIHDWVAFYRAEHGAQAALIYDNGSTAYTAAELEAGLRAAFPDMVIDVVSWDYRYGPQGGMAGAVQGQETPWDSDFCQTGSLQHARHRFLRKARSVLNVDVDEVLPAPDGQSIFAATERSRGGFIKFAGHWIAAVAPHAPDPATARHGDFTWSDRAESRTCPPKWCVVPARADPRRTSWSVHNLFGTRHNKVIDRRFTYRHMMAISNNWKESRWSAADFDPARYDEDALLAAAFLRSGLSQPR